MVATLTKKEAEDIVKMLDDGKTLTEAIGTLKIAASKVHSFVANCIFLPVGKRTPEQEIFRDKILDVLLSESILKRALQAVSEITEKRSIKVTTLLNLSKAERESLEKQGYADFVEECDDAVVTLKVEETKEIIPPNIKLLEKLVGLAEGTVSAKDIFKQLTPFSPVDSSLEKEV